MEVVAGGANAVVKKGAGTEDVAGKLVAGGAVLGWLLLGTCVASTVVGRFVVAMSDDDGSREVKGTADVI
jgi:hypothetical protein